MRAESLSIVMKILLGVTSQLDTQSLEKILLGIKAISIMWFRHFFNRIWTNRNNATVESIIGEISEQTCKHLGSYGKRSNVL